MAQTARSLTSTGVELTSDGLVEMLTSKRARLSHADEIRRFAGLVCGLLKSSDEVPSWDVVTQRVIGSAGWSRSDQSAIVDARECLGEDECRRLYNEVVSARERI